MIRVRSGAPVAAVISLGAWLVAQTQIDGPAAVRNSNLVVRLEAAGAMTAHKNPTSPVVAGDRLLLVDQAGVMRLSRPTARIKSCSTPRRSRRA